MRLGSRSRGHGGGRSAAAQVTPLPPVGEGDHVLGRPDAKLTVVEYGDFGCPYCFAAKLPIESLLQRYDDLRLVWRHLPDPELHPGADLAAELSELAASHGKFWQAHSLLLAGRGEFSTDDLLGVAGALELREEAEAALRDRTLSRPRGGRPRRRRGRRGARHAHVLHRRGANVGALAPARGDGSRRAQLSITAVLVRSPRDQRWPAFQAQYSSLMQFAAGRSPRRRSAQE